MQASQSVGIFACGRTSMTKVFIMDSSKVVQLALRKFAFNDSKESISCTRIPDSFWQKTLRRYDFWSSLSISICHSAKKQQNTCQCAQIGRSYELMKWDQQPTWFQRSTITSWSTQFKANVTNRRQILKLWLHCLTTNSRTWIIKNLNVSIQFLKFTWSPVDNYITLNHCLPLIKFNKTCLIVT